MSTELLVENDGSLIVSTDYWTSTFAERGLVFFSVNAGCVRVLLPKTFGLADVLSTTVIISRGKYRGQDAYEVLFDDGSEEPFVILTGVEQWDRLLPASDSGRSDIGFHIYKQGRRIEETVACFRVVDRLPYMKPWKPSAASQPTSSRSNIVSVAGLDGMTIPGRRYHTTLSKELEAHYAYVKDAGHCIVCVVTSQAEAKPDKPPTRFLVPVSVKMVLRLGWAVKNGLVWCDAPYDPMLGVYDPEHRDDDEY
jgi:hypothetical protein